MAIRVLLVDDSAIIRGLMSRELTNDRNITVAGSAADGIMAIQSAKQLHPDIIVLDIEMPRMDGITALPELLKASPTSKIIMASTLTSRNAAISMQALALGASDYVAKPSSNSADGLKEFYRELITKIYALAPRSALAATSPELKTPVLAPAKSAAKPYPVLAAGTPLNPMGISALAIASSTGGPQALTSLFGQLKGHLKAIPIFITQHMPPTFTTILADHISKAGDRICREAKDGELVTAGCIYLAPGNYHMVVEKNAAGQCILRTNQDAQENFCRPAADPMLRSLSLMYGTHLAAVVLTGMGQDGMEGAKAVNAKGGSVIAQDEASCVVYGMPKAVVENNLCKAVLPLADMGAFLIRQIEGAGR